MRLTQKVIDEIQLAMTHTKMNGETYEFKWDLIYQYIGKINE